MTETSRSEHGALEDPFARLARKLEDVPIADAELADSADSGASNSTASSVPPQIRRLGDYQLIDKLGEGGMGTVYLARQRSLSDKLVALKVLPPFFAFDPKRVARFRTEATIASRVNHPGIVSILHIGEQDGIHFIVQELIEGGRSLADWISERRDNPTLAKSHYVNLAQLFAKVADALDTVHAANVLHRDIKPSNILITPLGEPKVADFGLAKDLEGVAALTSGESPGTPSYKSPEQVDKRLGSVDARSDVFALGVSLYEALTFVRLFDGDNHQEIYEKIRYREVDDPRTLRAGVPAELALICRKAIEKEPKRRYRAMRDLADDLRRYLANEPIQATPPSLARRAQLWAKRNVVAAALSIASIVVVATAATAVSLVLSTNEQLTRTNNDLAIQKTAAQGEAAAATLARADAQQKQRDAEESRKLAQQRLAESYVQTARFAGQRGRWNEALSALNKAGEEGFADKITLQVELARAHLALSERLPATQILDDLLALDDLAVHRGEVLLMRAHLAMSESKDQARALELVREARAAELSKADDLFAQGLLATTTPDALALMQAAIAADPFHYMALNYELTLLLVLGRFDEALVVAESTARIFPEDPGPPSVRASVFALRGDMNAARLEQQRCEMRGAEKVSAKLGELLNLIEFLNNNNCIEGWIGAPPPPGRLDFNFAGAVTALTANWDTPLRQTEQGIDIGLFNLNLPSLRQGIGEAIEALRGMFLGDLPSDSTESVRRLNAALEVHPEGLLYYLRGSLEVHLPAPDRQTLVDNLARAELSYRKASETPSLFPMASRAARYWATYAEVMLAKNQITGGDPAMMPFVRQNVEWLAAQPDLSSYECAILSGEMFSREFEPSLINKLVERWAEIAPDDNGALGARCRIALAQGAFRRALELVEQMEAKGVGKEHFDPLREQALSGIRDMASAVQPTKQD